MDEPTSSIFSVWGFLTIEFKKTLQAFWTLAGLTLHKPHRFLKPVRFIYVY
jgi:hypothetical protein